MTSSEMKTYLKSVQSSISCKRAEKKRFMDDFTVSVSSFVDENPDITYSELQRKFGLPEEIARSFIEENNSRSVSAILKDKKAVKYIAVACLVVLVISLVVLGFHAADFWDFSHGYVNETVASEGVFDPQNDNMGSDSSFAID